MSKYDVDIRRPFNTDPPPSSFPPPPKAPKHGVSQFVKAHMGTFTIKDLVYIGGLLLGAVTWAQTRASHDEVEAARRSCVDSTTAAITSALSPLIPTIPLRLKAAEKKQARNDQRWDRLDSWHSKAFRSPFKTPPPKFGPTAETHGEVRYDDEEEE